MRFHAYVLHSKVFDRIYIGYSSDLEARLKSHNDLELKDGQFDIGHGS